jgi:hypothetical protein
VILWCCICLDDFVSFLKLFFLYVHKYLARRSGANGIGMGVSAVFGCLGVSKGRFFADIVRIPP